MKKPLIVYYSFSGNTRTLAQKIAELTSGDIHALIPLKLYDFSCNTAAKEVRNEISRGFCPKLSSRIDKAEEYKVIFLGTPNWFKSLAPPLLTFLRGNDLSGKTIVPFCTHGGGGFGEIEKRIVEECPNSNFLPGLAATDATTSEQISNWLEENNLLDIQDI